MIRQFVVPENSEQRLTGPIFGVRVSVVGPSITTLGEEASPGLLEVGPDSPAPYLTINDGEQFQVLGCLSLTTHKPYDRVRVSNPQYSRATCLVEVSEDSKDAVGESSARRFADVDSAFRQSVAANLMVKLLALSVLPIVSAGPAVFLSGLLEAFRYQSILLTVVGENLNAVGGATAFGLAAFDDVLQEQLWAVDTGTSFEPTGGQQSFSLEVGRVGQAVTVAGNGGYVVQPTPRAPYVRPFIKVTSGLFGPGLVPASLAVYGVG